MGDFCANFRHAFEVQLCRSGNTLKTLRAAFDVTASHSVLDEHFFGIVALDREMAFLGGRAYLAGAIDIKIADRQSRVSVLLADLGGSLGLVLSLDDAIRMSPSDLFRKSLDHQLCQRELPTGHLVGKVGKHLLEPGANIVDRMDRSFWRRSVALARRS